MLHELRPTSISYATEAALQHRFFTVKVYAFGNPPSSSLEAVLAALGLPTWEPLVRLLEDLAGERGVTTSNALPLDFPIGVTRRPPSGDRLLLGFGLCARIVSSGVWRNLTGDKMSEGTARCGVGTLTAGVGTLICPLKSLVCATHTHTHAHARTRTTHARTHAHNTHTAHTHRQHTHTHMYIYTHRA